MSVIKHGTQGCGGHCCLRISDLGVNIDGTDILKDVNLHIHCGEIVALIGPNGAGKSTLLRSILGQQEHTGTISFFPAGQGSRRLRIGYVPQSPSFAHGDPVTVMDLFRMCVGRVPAFLPVSRRQREQFLSALQPVRGEGLLDKKIGSLSGGELQRVLLALALQPMPDVLILDEPLSGVDVEGMHTLLSMLDEIRRELDLSILMVTHDFSVLDGFVDQAILLKETVLCQGKPEAVLASSAFREAFHMAGGET